MALVPPDARTLAGAFLAASAFCHAAAGGLPAARDPLAWPFAANSIWNMPIGSGAVYVPARIPPSGAMGMTEDEDILILTPDAPLVDVVENTAGWDKDKRRCATLTAKILFRAPIPAGFSTDPGYMGQTPNMGAAILMADGKTLKQTQPFHRCGPGGTATSQYLFPDVDITGSGIPGAHGGSGMSAIGGTLRLGELVPGGVIRHVMKVNLYAARNLAYNDDGSRGYRWPALNADGYAAGTYRGQVPPLEMGALLALRPEFAVDALRTEPGRILARAFRDYGAYVVDDTAWDVYGMETEWSPKGRLLDEFKAAWGWDFTNGTKSTCTDASQACQWAKDMADLFTALHVVDNNSPTSIGGGGTPRQPLAPPFGPGTSLLDPRRGMVMELRDRGFRVSGRGDPLAPWFDLLGREQYLPVLSVLPQP